MHRRHLLLGATALAISFARTARAATPAETFVAANIQAGFNILNDKTLDAPARRGRFAAFLLALTDMRRVALFLLGPAAQTASPADLDAYLAAYQDFIMAVYQSYFALYAGQTLSVVSSRERAKDDFIVTTRMVGGGAPTQIDFRVRTDGPKPVLVDVGVSGVWLALAQRDQFTSVLSQNHGDIKALTAHLRAAQQNQR
jgi:phospholipid transport system substrate-binding protein